MKQRSSYKLVVYFDIVQDLPDNTSLNEVLKHLDNIKIGLERQVCEAITKNFHDNNAKIEITKLPKIYYKSL